MKGTRTVSMNLIRNLRTRVSREGALDVV